MKSAIESETTGRGNVQQVISVNIKDSIIQRSDLLSFCDINGNCKGDVVAEGGDVQHGSMEVNIKTKVHNNKHNLNLCSSCDAKLPDGSKFCMECGSNLT